MLMPRTAASTSASGKTITGSDPPSSAETRLNLGAAISMILRPVCVLPVRATLLTSGWVASGSPTSLPGPVTTLSTPGGSSTSCISSATRSVASGVVLAGFTTIVLPAASAASTSYGPPFGTASNSSSVAGFTTGVSSPDLAPTCSPPINACVMLGISFRYLAYRILRASHVLQPERLVLAGCHLHPFRGGTAQILLHLSRHAGSEYLRRYL